MYKVLLETNIPTPYRLALFHFLQKHSKEYEICVLYVANSVDNRKWNVDKRKLINTHFVDSKIVARKSKFDTNHTFIPTSIFSCLNRIDPDVLIAWEYGPAAVMSWIWSKIKRKKYINLTDGTIYSERHINIGQKLTRKLIIPHSDAAIASSTKAKEKLIKWGIKEDKVFISLLTTDMDQWKGIQRKTVSGRILYVGSMIERKGIDLLIDALKQVSCDFTLHIVGNGTEEEKAELEKRIKTAELYEKIKLCGFKEGAELVEEFAEAEVFVLPTREDCFGLVLLEALCAEIPIISSKYADGAYDIIEEGNNGLLVDPYNAEEFALYIEKVLKKEIHLKGKQDQIVKKFTFENVSKGYFEAIRFVMNAEVRKD